MTKLKEVEIALGELVGGGYKKFWNFRGRYRVVKGSRASKKSKTAALWFIYNLMKYPEANLLVVRKTFCTLKASCFTELKWAIRRLRVERFWEISESPLEMMYKPTGQRIYFRGLDDPMKITSITVGVGVLCWMWVEEAYELAREEDFDVIDESIRGAVPDGLFKQITLTFNPWNANHWLKRRFFDEQVGVDAAGVPIYSERKNNISDDGEILAMTTDYTCNEWLDESDRKLFERMKAENPSRFRVAGLGEWGSSEGLVYENFTVSDFSVDELRKMPGIKAVFGLDFGYTNDPSALFCGLADIASKRLYVFDELYSAGLTNLQLFDEINSRGYVKEKITADSASPKDIAELRGLGLLRIRAAVKGADSVNHGIQFARNFRIIIHPRCKNFFYEISNYRWAMDKLGHAKNVPVDSDNHLMDAMRYALEELNRGKAFSWD